MEAVVKTQTESTQTQVLPQEPVEKEPKTKVLIVDDETTIRRILETRLKLSGYQVDIAIDGEEAIEKFNTYHPDIVILDIMLPKIDGFAVCKEIRSYSEVPVIILSAVTDVADRIKGLEMGADDYVTKPFSPNELEARIKAVLRRVTDRPMEQASGHSNNVIVIGNLKIDTSKRQVYKSHTDCSVKKQSYNRTISAAGAQIRSFDALILPGFCIIFSFLHAKVAARPPFCYNAHSVLFG